MAENQLMIRPTDTLKFKWDLLIIIGAIFNCFCIPVQLAYSPKFMESSSFLLINTIVDFFFILDIFVSFRTTYIDNRGLEVFD